MTTTDLDPAVAAEAALEADPDVVGVVVESSPNMSVRAVQVAIRAGADPDALRTRARHAFRASGIDVPTITVVPTAPDPVDASSRRVTLVQAAVLATPEGTAAVVRLREGERVETGTARGPLTAAPMELAARATVEAYLRVQRRTARHDVVVAAGPVGDRTAVAVLLTGPGEVQRLGSALTDGVPPHLASARATLDALNRGPAPQ